MEVSKNYGHQHPLVLLNEEQLITHQSGVIADCSRCGEKVSAPCFRCAEDCGFYLHKVCADAPLELNHPFHRNHPLLLMQKAPYRWICDFCDGMGEKFVYHCSCGLDLHIKCALFTFNIAQNNLKALEHVALEDPLISTKIDVRKCFGCWEPLANDAYFSPHSIGSLARYAKKPDEEDLFMVVHLASLLSTFNVYHRNPSLKIKVIHAHSLRS
ncbi:Cysteine/Histidine-rich C1 domain family protein, putative isoform 2 [Hibiscus syriacus]|uniref:Cysteine/Histidine-rich C1 domain family protein, putative isoform 2 n=1 Tax=Hibiscus syriacus TaxID=106335 RepID=A0A6A3AEG9_HIBSY|nr:Cysteine/Histidine-rich C1 domain family protein, putative isoform 2 [Hibiscus syriacus]